MKESSEILQVEQSSSPKVTSSFSASGALALEHLAARTVPSPQISTEMLLLKQTADQTVTLPQALSDAAKSVLTGLQPRNNPQVQQRFH